MSRVDFMKELESLLSDIPQEEKKEALQYYNDYFEDAGTEHEDEVINELGTPARVAETIKANLDSNGDENGGYFTEKGYQDTSYQGEKFEIVDPLKQRKDNGQDNGKPGNGQEFYNKQSNNGQNYGNDKNYNSQNFSNGQNYNNGKSNNSQGFNNGRNNNNGQNYSNGQNYNNSQSYSNGQYNNGQSYNQTNNRKQNSNNSNLLLILIICTFPIWLPIACTIFGLVIAAFATVFALLIGFGAAGIAMVAAGVALFVVGLVRIAVPFELLVLCGSGLLIFGLGILFVLFSAMLCRKVLPALVKGVVELCRLPFKNRSVTA